MIIKIFDNGWGPEWPAKQFEKQITDRLLHRLINDNSATVVINSTWYSKEFHELVIQQLRQLEFSHLVLVAMLDPAIPQANWYKEFDCEVYCVGYYPGPYCVDYWALFTHQYNHDTAGMDATAIDTAFMCLNRKPHWHRKQLYAELVSSGLENRGLVSFGFDKILSIDVEHDDMAPQASRNKFGVPNDLVSLGHPENWARHFVNIVTETVYDPDTTCFVSEKIYKPVIGCRPFLVYGLNGARNWLEEKGFESYVDDFKDISNLDLSNPKCIPDFLRTLCDQPKTYWQKKFVDLQNKILYNKNQFYNYIKQQHLLIDKGI